MFLCTLPNSKSIKFRLWGIRIKQCGSIWFWYSTKLLHCYTSYSSLLFRICVWLHHFFYRAFLSLLNLVVSLQSRLVRSAVALQLFVVSPARHHRLVLAAVIQFVCLHHRLERVWPVDVVVFQLPKLVVSHHRLVLLVVFQLLKLVVSSRFLIKYLNIV